MMLKKPLVFLAGIVGLCLATVVAAQQPRDLTAEERNKKIALSFLQEFFGDHDLTAAERYLVPDYIQHNPRVADGRDALVNAVRDLLANAPKAKLDLQRASAEGDLVWIHHRVKFEAVSAVVDIFRFNKEGKIVEHWDVIQAVPEKSANPHPMF
ncbi:nuclear transport factor 2 family protein [Bradyrhizobium liaoningense]|uniref:nuclear transport factor 2 family protein n=1 Tax=Bradyrhizobium liaoningense TaxID=43992 RepID=UPI001BA748A9|nr:nuclear transport factor 2 family protein [Bradyrhizobium liaoningense]MBR0706989.1 nuclear transport factor 2 family protein [Bradyrhizobium liaoningense]